MNIQEYSLAILSVNGRVKTPTAIAEEIGINQSAVSRFLKTLSTSSNDFLPQIKKMFGKKRLNFATDDSCLIRRYSEKTEAVSCMKDQSTKTFTKGTSIVFGGLTDGTYFLPLDLEQWIAEFIMQDAYLTKPELAQRIVNRMINMGLNINHYVFDGHYFKQEFIEFLDSKNLKFVIKAKTTTSVLFKNKKIQLQHIPELKLNSNQNCKKIKAYWNGRYWYFIALRRTGKHGEKIIYLIANFYSKSKIYAQTYDSRWVVEKFIRTAKQHLGLNRSQSRYAITYLNHIRCVFWAYTILQFIMKKFQLNSTEDALRLFQAQKNQYSIHKIHDWINLLVYDA